MLDASSSWAATHCHGRAERTDYLTRTLPLVLLVTVLANWFWNEPKRIARKAARDAELASPPRYGE